MTWSSDRTSVLLYAVLATLLVMAWIYVPAWDASHADQACPQRWRGRRANERQKPSCCR